MASTASKGPDVKRELILIITAGGKSTLNSAKNRRRVQLCLQVYLLVLVGSDVLVWLWFLLHRHGPHHFPLGERVERFGDLLRFSGKYQIGKDPRMADGAHLIGTLFPKNYPPLSVVVYLFLLQQCAPYALPILLTVMLGGILVSCIILWKRLRSARAYRWYIGTAVFVTGLFGWGTEQVFMRANIEGLLWIGVAFGAFSFAHGKHKTAAVSFGVACCLKPQPILWLVFMARERKYRAIVVGIVSAALITLSSLLAIDRNPLRAYDHISGKSTFFQDYVVSFRPIEEAKGDHSLLQSMKMVSRVIRYRGFTFPHYEQVTLQSNHPVAQKLYHAYLPIALIIGVLVIWTVWNKPILNQMFAIACVTTVLPMVAGDYTFNVLLIPMGFYAIYLLEDVAEGRSTMSAASILWVLVPCAWIMATQPLWLLHGVFKCVAVLVLLTVSISIPMHTTMFGELPKKSVVQSA
jgi:hypothetical protein